MTLKTSTIRDLRNIAARKALVMPAKYDKRFKNSWLFLLGEPSVEPVERKQIVHIKKEVPKLTINWAEISKVING